MTDAWAEKKKEEGTDIVIFSCNTCFYSQGTVENANAYGRDKGGVEAESEDLLIEHCICYAEPKPILVSEQIVDGVVPDVRQEPSYHMCGRGRWWKDGKWVKWIDLEN